jgi:hypothetical protein
VIKLKVQYCWPIGKTAGWQSGYRLWEFAAFGGSDCQDHFCVEGKTMVLLHGFIRRRKDAQKELDLAERESS